LIFLFIFGTGFSQEARAVPVPACAGTGSKNKSLCRVDQRSLDDWQRWPLFYGVQPAARSLLTDLQKVGIKAGIFLRSILRLPVIPEY